MILRLLIVISMSSIAWSGNVCFTFCSLTFPLIWSVSKTRKEAFFLAICYHAVATKDLVTGAATCFNSTNFGFLYWILASILPSVVYYIFWSKRRKLRPLLIPVVLTFSFLPPFGAVGIVNPLIASGSLFKGLGYSGLAITMICLVVAGYLIQKRKLNLLYFTPIILLSFLYAKPQTPHNFHPVNTYFGESEHVNDLIRRSESLDHLKKDSIVVFPENHTGIWNREQEIFWGKASSNFDTQILLGTGGKNIGNFIVLAEDGETKIVYHQQIPLPIAAWKPWKKNSPELKFFSNSTFEIKSQKVAPLICYECFLSWPVLKASLDNPDILVGITNMWWAKDTDLVAIQRQTMQCWAMLFDLPLVMASNY